MRDGRTLAMIAVTVLVGVLAIVYVVFNRDGESGGWAMPAGAALLLILLVVVSAGASRRRRVVRDEEDIGERKEGDR
jgi:hypothetical protein